jgi:hypothetical protein
MPQTGPAWTDTGHVFTLPDGPPWHPADVTDTFTAAATAANFAARRPAESHSSGGRGTHGGSRQAQGLMHHAHPALRRASPDEARPVSGPLRSPCRLPNDAGPNRILEWSGNASPSPAVAVISDG